MTIAASLLAANAAVAFAALMVGMHAVEWWLKDAEDGPSRCASFRLAAHCHTACALAALVLAGLALSTGVDLAWAIALVGTGTALFCGALYAHALFSITWTMPGTLAGAALVAAGWLSASWSLWRLAQ